MDEKLLKRVLGEEVRKRRLERRLTQEQAADSCDVHVNSLKRLESGLLHMRWLTLAKVAIGLEMPLSDLVGRVERRPEFVRAIQRYKRANRE